MSFFNKLSFQSKILSMLLVTSLLSILLIGYLGYASGRNTITQAVLNQLTSIRNSRAEEIENYFGEAQNNALNLSEGLTVVEALKEFKTAYNQLGNQQIAAAQRKKIEEYYRQKFIPKLALNIQSRVLPETYFPQTPASEYLQYYYLASNPNDLTEKDKIDAPGDGSAYSRVHKKYHYRFKNLIQRMGYYDMILIDNDTGNILYTSKKEVDFGTNLKSGPYANSNLARAYQETLRSRDPDFVTAVDFEPYRPSLGEPAAFIVATVFDDDRFIGVLALQLSGEKINEVMTIQQKWREVGLGQSGETFLIGQDALLRSVPRLFIEDREAYFTTLTKAGYSPDKVRKIQNLKSPLLVQKISTEAVEKVLKGETGTAFYEDYRKVPVIGAYQPIELGNFQWALIAKMDRAEAFQGVKNLTNRLIAATAILIPLLTLGALFFSRLLARPLNKLIAATKRLAAGETDVKVNIRSKDEFGELAESFNQMTENIRSKEQMVTKKIEENDRLLLNILPAPIAKRLQSGEQGIADSFPNVTVMFAEIEGFSDFSKDFSPNKAVTLLNELVGSFDETAELYGVEKLKTIGESYLAVCGLTVPRVDHSKRMVDFAQALLKAVRRFNQKQGCDLSLDIGIHSGPVVAGIVGKTKFIYELWGETMNIAKAIHSSPEKNIIQVSQPVYDDLKGLYHLEPLKEVEVRGKRKIPVWSVHPLESLVNFGQDREAQ